LFESDLFITRIRGFFKFRRKKLFLLKLTRFTFRDFKTHKINNYIYVDL
jgi:hypothetical protein